MHADYELYSDTFQPSTRAVTVLLILSCLWFGLDGVALLPVGLLATLHYVGRNYETTWFSSIRTGWRLVLFSLGLTVLGWLMGPKLFIWAKGGGVGIEFVLFSLDMNL